MMGPGDGLDFLCYPPPSPPKHTLGKAERELPREAETMVAAAAEAAAAVQTAASFSTTTNPSQSFSVVGEERNIDSQCNMEWPTNWFIEEPRAIHQDWPMNSKFDLNIDYRVDSQVELNMDCNIQQEIDVDDSFRMDDIMVGDIEYESRSSNESARWMLTDKHAVAAIHKSKQFPEDYVSDFFKKPMYKEAYKNFIYPVPGQHGWTKTDSPNIDPPEYKTKRGRKQKKRRRGQHESSKSTVQNKMTTIKCSNCKLQGHRYTNCGTPLKPHLAARKAQHKTVRRLPDPQCHAAPPTAPHHYVAPPPAPQRNAAPPLAPRRNAASSSSHESTVIGRTPNANGLSLGVRGFERTRLYSYFTVGLHHQQENFQQK